MKRTKLALFAAAFVLATGMLFSLNAKADSETCTVEVGGAGHCIQYVDPDGNVVGYDCFSGSGEVPCNH